MKRSHSSQTSTSKHGIPDRAPPDLSKGTLLSLAEDGVPPRADILAGRSSYQEGLVQSQ